MCYDEKGRTWTAQEVDTVKCPKCLELLKHCECVEKHKYWKYTYDQYGNKKIL